MSLADWIGMAGFLLSLIALWWQWSTQINDRRGKIKVEVTAEPDLVFHDPIHGSTSSIRRQSRKVSNRFIITITNIGREPRVLKSYRIQVLDGDKDLKIYEYYNKTIAMGAIVSEAFIPAEEIKNGTRFTVIVEDSLGKKYESRAFDIKELTI